MHFQKNPAVKKAVEPTLVLILAVVVKTFFFKKLAGNLPLDHSTCIIHKNKRTAADLCSCGPRFAVKLLQYIDRRISVVAIHKGDKFSPSPFQA